MRSLTGYRVMTSSYIYVCVMSLSSARVILFGNNNKENIKKYKETSVTLSERKWEYECENKII